MDCGNRDTAGVDGIGPPGPVGADAGWRAGTPTTTTTRAGPQPERIGRIWGRRLAVLMTPGSFGVKSSTREQGLQLGPCCAVATGAILIT